jgi:anthranilate phosphoribosyltransferase
VNDATIDTTEHTWAEVLTALTRRVDLRADQAAWAMGTILAGNATDAQIAGFAVGLRTKGETDEELAAVVETMRRLGEHVPVPLNLEGRLIDTCGTGGDRSGTVNVSTMAAIVATAAGAKVAKHGNRALSSQSGSADVLEALGVVIDLGPEGVAHCLREVGIGFCFAPRFHPAMRFAGPVRKELGAPTTFNFLGPLTNPAGVRRQAIGVSDPQMAERMLRTLARLGTERALAFHGLDGLDELTITGPSRVYSLQDGEVNVTEITPEQFGFERADLSSLAGGDAAANAKVVRAILDGDRGPVRDVVLLNTAAALLVDGVDADFAAGITRAGEAIDSGAAAAVLEDWVTASRAASEG